MIRLPSFSRRRAVAAAALGVSLAMAGTARAGHTQQTYEGGLWRSSNGEYWCGSTCNKSINQVCCSFIVDPT
jgi:hypothetical protein